MNKRNFEAVQEAIKCCIARAHGTKDILFIEVATALLAIVCELEGKELPENVEEQ